MTTTTGPTTGPTTGTTTGTSPTKPAARGLRRSAAPATLLGGLPQVNLLPSEVLEERALSRVKLRLVGGIAAVVVVIGAGYAGSLVVLSGADDELAAADARRVELTTQADQYVQVPQVLSQVRLVEQARTAGTASEVLWAPYLAAITAVLPAGTSIDSVSVSSPDPTLGTGAAATTTAPLRTAGVGTVTLALRSATVPDTAALSDALGALHGMTDPWVSSLARTTSDAGTDHYTVTATVQLTTDAYAARFAADGGTDQ